MPGTAAFIDAMRQAFGSEMIDAQIRKGLKGETTFYARENGHELGTPWIKEKKHAAHQVD
ncbi:hypothetical protein GCM10027278_38080 [Paralcaligenes ginsengisoli]